MSSKFLHVNDVYFVVSNRLAGSLMGGVFHFYFRRDSCPCVSRSPLFLPSCVSR